MKLFKKKKVKCYIRKCKNEVTHIGAGLNPTRCFCSDHYSLFILH